ncbi:BQ5605_C008g05292 [Microbotryum silenes-dioicae]|uniref:Phospholipase D1 n=1 Tax=Microbotryum silenes-dioicae TaxID=796604 RepID=A0A2X0MG26_9BASI|nr:BQ5605_C008g05292 [Microbotryum silenes-dioicae]
MDFAHIVKQAREQQKSHGFKSPHHLSLNSNQSDHHYDEGVTPGSTPASPGFNGARFRSSHSPANAETSLARPISRGAGAGAPSTPGSGTQPASTPTPTPTRPRHRSQASFDWFADLPPNSSSGTGFPTLGQQTSSRNPSSRNPSFSKRDSRWNPSTSNGHACVSDSPRELSEAEEEDENQDNGNRKKKSLKSGSLESSIPPKDEEPPGKGKRSSRDLGKSSQSDQSEFRGAFTEEDMTRGARALKRRSGSESAASGPRRNSTMNSQHDEARDRFQELPEESSPHTAGTVPDKGKDQPGSSSTGAAPPPLGGRKQSLWQGAAELFGVSSGSGPAPAEAEAEEADNEELDGDPEARKAKVSQGARKSSAWGVVKKKLGGETKQPKQKAGATLTGHELIAELTTGILPMVIVKMAVMDRDERGEHRIPILMNYLKLRITDSVYPFHDRHAVFRCELEYGDAAVKWVIYRELKDFINLHAHYRVANLRQGIEKFPTFPKTSIPYLNWLKSERGGSIAKADFAKAQRKALEDYLLKLIRATMFGPGANRLCKFLEISAMSLSLATRGGEQGKQGYLTIASSGASRRKAPGFHPLAFSNRHQPKWFIVRDSFIVAVDDPASTEIYDVIMVDSTFELERPKRILRQGLNAITFNSDSSEEADGHQDDIVASEKKPMGYRGAGDPNDPSTTGAGSDLNKLKETSNHTFYLRTSERKLRLIAKTERQQDQFIASIEKMLAKTIWAGKNRFDSFAPIRLNASAQWLIDGRDYFWSLSRAILLAKHRIYIHDWWLSPELYMRRPAAENEQWRLDRLLQKKAEEGVQIFVVSYRSMGNDALLRSYSDAPSLLLHQIVYKEVSNDFTPVESNYTKSRLRGLHPNVHIQRSPSHTSTGTLLWSHHEKMCVIDETIGFMGGLDLCFGRWDTPGHVLTDEQPNVVFDPELSKSADAEARAGSQIWPGKDYSNSRVLDFHTLTKPEEDMYDRGKVPRQPWHDIGLQIIGQPARDLCRHFIQRWNYLLRTKNHTVKMPFLLPAPDFTPKELHDQRITGTCEVQICRSVGPWSMGISHVEHSIQNAYIKAIQLSDHFVYIENQFFITSTEVESTIIENRIGDALVSRILRAHSEGTAWRAIIIIPLVPGCELLSNPFPVDHSDAGSVRLIMECQYRSICRGEHSIFARLRHEGIDPDEYITFFGLRGWGKMISGMLTTEAVYIHAKAMIVDDRIAIIGSANINERSQRGDRDSELACIIRDTDMIDSTMGGKPYKVGRFAHTMRVRLMREHLGVDVDELDAGDEDLLEQTDDETSRQEADEAWDPDNEQKKGDQGGQRVGHTFHWAESVAKTMGENTGSVISGAKETVSLGMQKGAGKVDNHLKGVVDRMDGASDGAVHREEETSAADKIIQGEKGGKGFASTVVPTLEEKVMAEERPTDDQKTKSGLREGKLSANQRERAEGVTVNPPGASGVHEHRNESDDKASKTKQASNDAEKHLGEKMTMSSPEADDVRKFEREPVMEGDDGKSTSTTSSKEEGTELHHKHLDPVVPKTETVDGKSRIQDDAPPPDSKPKDGANGSLSDESSKNRSSSPSTAKASSSTTPSSPSSSASPSAKANEAAANRTTITGTLRRNLRERSNIYSIPVPAPKIDPFGFSDPIVDSFFKNVWLAAAVRNTQAYRKVFRCVPDDLVQTWKQYREFQIWAERHNKAPKDVVSPGDEAPHTDPDHHSGQHGAGGSGSGGGAMGQGQDDPPKGETMHKISTRGDRAASTGNSVTSPTGTSSPADNGGPSVKRDRSGTLAGEGHDHEEGFPGWEREQMEKCLDQLSGCLVVFPTRFLEAESAGGNFLFSKDRLPPLSIYD